MTEDSDFEKLNKLIEEGKGESEKEFCPNCGSQKLYYYMGMKMGQIYVCKNCGYQGPVTILDGELAEELRKRYEAEEEEKSEES